jgi:hypothetical protein
LTIWPVLSTQVMGLGMLQDPDIVERIALHQDEVGPLARCECPHGVLNADGLGRHPG